MTDTGSHTTKRERRLMWTIGILSAAFGFAASHFQLLGSPETFAIVVVIAGVVWSAVRLLQRHRA